MLSLYFLFSHVFLIVIVGMARVLPIFLFLPYLNNQVISGAIVKNTIAVFFIIGILPIVMPQTENLLSDALPLILLKEVVIGTICGVIIAFPFWVALAIGQIIDNQRGATISSSMNPLTGVDTSTTAILMNYFFLALFVLNGGMTTLCEAITQSYHIWPINQSLELNKEIALRIVSLMNAMMIKALLLSAPVVVALFVLECAVGILSRFAPQLNAFSVALAIKSMVAFFMLLISLAPVVAPRLLSIDIRALLSGFAK